MSQRVKKQIVMPVHYSMADVRLGSLINIGCAKLPRSWGIILACSNSTDVINEFHRDGDYLWAMWADDEESAIRIFKEATDSDMMPTDKGGRMSCYFVRYHPHICVVKTIGGIDMEKVHSVVKRPQ